MSCHVLTCAQVSGNVMFSRFHANNRDMGWSLQALILYASYFYDKTIRSHLYFPRIYTSLNMKTVPASS